MVLKLSVLIPVFNEEATVALVVRSVMGLTISGVEDIEIIAVNDGSTDRTRRVLADLEAEFTGRFIVCEHKHNQGKGAAVRTAVGQMTGELCIIQDADLEYDPQDQALLLEPLIQGRADVVYGSRFKGPQAKRVLYFWHYVGNHCLTILSNILTNVNLTDMETGLKAFRSDVLRSIDIVSNGFGLEPEITVKLARKNLRIFEVGIGYNGRTYAEGKKVMWWDGFKAIGALLRFRFFK